MNLPLAIPQPPVLRPYQRRALDMVDSSIRSGKSAPLLVLATGSGKTVIAAEMMRREVDRGGRPLFLAPRRELVYQTAEKMHAVGLDFGTTMAGDEDAIDVLAPSQLASVDTMVSRLLKRRYPLAFPAPSMVIVDEAHLSITAAKQRLFALWPNAVRIGLTATPTRKDGKALGVLYDDLLEPVTVAELTEHGYLCPARYYSISEPDLAKVRIVAGDYNARQLEDAVAPMVGDVVETWLERAGGRRTVVFACSIAHSAALQAEFERAGVAAEHVDAGTPQDERRGIFDRFRAGRTQVLCNCFLAAYGFDAPEVSCIVLARPTRSLMLYLQMLGRGLRPAKGSTDCLVLDHSGAVHEHGFATDERPWTLDGTYALGQPPARRKKDREEKTITCSRCKAVYSKRPACPECGYQPPRRQEMVETIDGDLVEIGAGLAAEQVDRLRWYRELAGLAHERGWKPGYAAVKFRDRFGGWPPRSWNGQPMLTPSAEVRRWVQAQLIAWRKSQDRR